MNEPLTVREVSERVRLSEYTVREAIRDGELPAIKLRGRLFVDAADVAAWQDQHRVQATPPVDHGPRPQLTPRLRPSPPPGGARAAIRALRGGRAA